MNITQYVKEHPWATGIIVLVGGFIFIMIFRGSSDTSSSGGVSRPSDAEIAANAQIAVTIGTGAEYGNTGFVHILFDTGANGLAFGKYTDSSGTRLVIKNTSTTAVSTSGVLYLLIMGVK